MRCIKWGNWNAGADGRDELALIVRALTGSTTFFNRCKRNMRTILATLIMSLGYLGSLAVAADERELSGYVVKLAEKTSIAEPQSVNAGGLVIAVVRDSGSRPPQDISVEASDTLQPLGKVRGVQNDQGVALMGGGYTWYLFQPTKAGAASVKVAYTENGDGGKRVERVYELTVEQRG